jgi:hypothetical protein
MRSFCDQVDGRVQASPTFRAWPLQGLEQP